MFFLICVVIDLFYTHHHSIFCRLLMDGTHSRCFHSSKNNNNIHVAASRSNSRLQQLIVRSISRRALATTSPPPPPSSVKATPDEPLFITRRRWEKSDAFMKTTWLADPSTYPIFFVLGTALAIAAVRCVHGFFYNDEVKVDPNRRASVVRSYDEKELSIKSSESVTVKPKTGRSFVAAFFERKSN